MNRKKIKNNCKKAAALSSSNKTFETVFNMMFENGDTVMAESNDGFRISRFTYNDVRALIEKTSAALYKKIGATHGYVGLEMENSLNWVVAFWSILRSGNKPYLINCRHPKSIADPIVKSLRIKYIIAEEQGELSGEYIPFSSLSHCGEPFEGQFENELAISTSATTLHEVVCFYTGREIAEQIACAAQIDKESPEIAYGCDGIIKVLAFLPFYHIFGLMAVYFWFSFFGDTIVFLRSSAPETIMSTCRRHRVTHISSVPMFWHSVEKQFERELEKKGPKKVKKLRRALRFTTALQNIFPHFGAKVARSLLSEATGSLFGDSLSYCISGGSYIRPSALYLFNGLGYSLRNGYGMSEIGVTSVELRGRPKDKNLGSIGHPLDSCEYRLDESGVLYVRGSSLAKRLMIDGQIFENNEWFCTGDIMKEEGGCYYILGRMGDRVISENGENINPDTVEAAITVNGAEAFSVLGLGDESEEHLSLVVSISPHLSDSRIRSIAKDAMEASSRLPLHMQIKDFYFTNDPLCPKTAVKVGRAYLKRAIREGSVKLTPFSEMKSSTTSADGAVIEDSPLALKIRDTIAHQLDISKESVGPDSHIINDLGASSLQYYSILSALADELGATDISDKKKYCYTLSDFCKYYSEL